MALVLRWPFVGVSAIPPVSMWASSSLGVTAAKPERFNLVAPDNDPADVDLDALMAATEPDEEPEPDHDLEDEVLDELN